jgi:hypothetical protein
MMKQLVVLVATLALVGCGTGSGNRSDTPAADSAAAGMSNMGSMQMDGGHDGMAMMPAMRRHMDSMAAVPPERIQGMMATHQERASAMLDAMGADMRRMNMVTDPAWEALTDSVKRDLADLPGLSGKAASDRMREHRGRMIRLMNAHEKMMGPR